jgi:hypothetical protein
MKSNFSQPQNLVAAADFEETESLRRRLGKSEVSAGDSAKARVSEGDD